MIHQKIWFNFRKFVLFTVIGSIVFSLCVTALYYAHTPQYMFGYPRARANLDTFIETIIFGLMIVVAVAFASALKTIMVIMNNQQG